MSRKIERQYLQRYSLPKVVDHLASNYVMGLLSPRVKKRVDALRRDFDHQKIDQCISFWEQKMAPLDSDTPELAPLPETWQNIHARLNLGNATAKESSQAKAKSVDQASTKGGKQAWWSSWSFPQWSGAFSFVFCVVIGFVLLQPTDDPVAIERGALSYVAVLEDNQQTPQVVAAIYGETKELVLDILTLPNVDAQQSLELWVISKTDKQSRSLGEIPQGQANFDRALSDAEWRLIADSSYLVISIEDEGGSAIGEPSESIISRGLCIQLGNRDIET